VPLRYQQVHQTENRDTLVLQQCHSHVTDVFDKHIIYFLVLLIINLYISYWCLCSPTHAESIPISSLWGRIMTLWD